MAAKYHPTPLSGGDRKALTKELGKARAMANILATQSADRDVSQSGFGLFAARRRKRPSPRCSLFVCLQPAFLKP